MNKYLKEYIKRGLIFSGLGPIVYGVVMLILDLCNVDIALSGGQILLSILSTYILAFVQAGSTVFEQIEEWSIVKSLFAHMFSVFGIYLVTYLVNSWIPFNVLVVIIFSASVIIGFLIIWLIIYLISNKNKNNLNKCLR